MKIAELRFCSRISSTALPFPYYNHLTHPRPLSGIPDTGLSDEEGINASARALAKRRFQFNIRPTTFPGGHTKAVVVFYFAQEIFYFILPPFLFFLIAPSPRGTFCRRRHPPAPYTPTTVPLNFEKTRRFYFFLFHPTLSRFLPTSFYFFVIYCVDRK